MNSRRILGTAMFIIVFVLLWVHISALQTSLYWRMPWFDTVVHFLGGAFVATAILFFILPYENLSKGFVRAGMILFGTFLVGILWEVFEHFFNIAFDPQKGFDNVVDLLMDVAGAYIVYVITINVSLTAKEIALLHNEEL